MLVRDKLFIGGRWVAPSGREMIDVHNAGTGEVMGRVPAGNASDVDAAVGAARRAFESWSNTPADKRAELLEKISANLKARADELAKTIAQRSEEHTSELQSLRHLVCRLLLEKKKNPYTTIK